MRGTGVADPPYLTDQERTDLYTLWRASHGRITPRDALSRMESWEVDLLLSGLRAEGIGVFDDESPVDRADDPLAQHNPDLTPSWVADLPAN